MVAQSTTSSASRETSTAVIAATNANSATKSRRGGAVDGVLDRGGEAEVGGDRLRVQAQRASRPAPPSRRARRRRGRPSRAAARRRAAAPTRGPAGGGRAAPAGRAAGGCDPAWRRRGGAPPGPTSASTTSRTRPPTTRACSRRYIRNRVATWSLRERPARSRPPTSAPARSMSPRSSAVWTSSSSSAGWKAPDSTSARSRSSPSSIAASVGVVEQPGARAGPGRGRASPAMSCGREPPVEVGGLATARRARRRARRRSGRPTGSRARPRVPRRGWRRRRHPAYRSGCPHPWASRWSRAAAILEDRPCSSMKPLASDWSNVSPSS